MAGRKCKCKICKSELNTIDAYKVVINNQNCYFCSEEEYTINQKNKKEESEGRNLVYEKINEIICISNNSLLYKSINELNSLYSYKLMYSYMCENQSYIEKAMNKNFNNGYAKIKYFIAILKNNMVGYEIPTDIVRTYDYDIIETKYKQRKKRRSLSEIEEEVINN